MGKTGSDTRACVPLSNNSPPRISAPGESAAADIHHMMSIRSSALSLPIKQVFPRSRETHTIPEAFYLV